MSEFASPDSRNNQPAKDPFAGIPTNFNYDRYGLPNLGTAKMPPRDIYVIEETTRGERAADIFSRLLKERIIVLDTPINDYVASLVTSQLRYLAAQDSKKEIEILINSPGGSVTAGLAILDTIDTIPNPVRVTCRGLAASMGAMILSCGTKGLRGSLPNSRIMIHQVRGGAEGTMDDMKITIAEAELLNETLMKLLAERTGKDIATVKKNCERDYFMSAKEALAYGLIDRIYHKDGIEDREGYHKFEDMKKK
jgi:ATP-dependent Clp protease protease subunit